MLKSMVALKGKTAHSLQIVTKKSDIVIINQGKAWMDNCLILTGICEVLLKRTKQHCLLVFDFFKAYITDDVMEALERVHAPVVVLPGGCTS